MNVSIEQAYETACRRLGEDQVRIAMLADEVDRTTSELTAARATILELAQQLEAVGSADQTVEQPEPTGRHHQDVPPTDPTTPLSETP